MKFFFRSFLAAISVMNFLLSNQKKEVAPTFFFLFFFLTVASMQWNAQLYLFMYFWFFFLSYESLLL